MEPGDVVELGGSASSLDEERQVQGPSYVAARAQIQVNKNGRAFTTLYPEKRVYMVQNMPMTEAAIDTGFTRDLYVSLGEAVSATAWVVKVQHKPFIDWIWGGCLLMALGGALAASDRRYPVAAKQRAPFTAAQAVTQSHCPNAAMNRFFLPLAFFAAPVGFLLVGLTLNPREV